MKNRVKEHLNNYLKNYEISVGKYYLRQAEVSVAQYLPTLQNI